MARKRARFQQRGTQSAQSTPTPLPGLDPAIAAAAEADAASVGYLDMQATSLKNLLKLKREIAKEGEREKSLQETLNSLGAQAAKEAKTYQDTVKEIQTYTKKAIDAKRNGDASALASAKNLLENYKEQEKLLLKTAGGSFQAQQIQATKRKKDLETEKKLIEDINQKRGVGNRIMDLFRSKEAKQRQIDIARAKVGGGGNIPPGGGGGGGGGGMEGALGGAAGANPYVAAAMVVTKVIKSAVQAGIAPMVTLGKLALSAMVSPFADAAQLLTGEDYGIGSGKVKTSGPSSLLGGIQEFAKSIPIVGGLLGGIAGILKTMVEGILGIEQGMFRFARAINVSFGQASRMRASFAAIAASSGHTAINYDRMMHSQAEIGNQLGVNKQLSADILKNDVLLRDVVGTEAEIRQSIAATSITSNRSAIKLTQSLIGSVAVFNKLRGTSFNFNAIMKDAAKLTGVIGLAFSKYPEKIAKALMSVKTLGMEMQQLDGAAGTLLDFESSISKEMEAQVLTGKEMNLTRAREAALSNDYATLAEEITKNVGKSKDFLLLNRIQQEAIAESVGMTANSLADVLKKQELYTRLGATDLKTYHEKIALLEKQGKTQEQISAMIGRDAYNEYTKLSTAEKITEILEKMKRAFVELIRQSGIFDFITKPERVTAFVRALADKLASTIDIVGRIIAGLMEGVASVVGFFSSRKASEIRSLAGTVRAGSTSLAENVRIATGVNSGQAAPSVGATVQNNARQQPQAASPNGATASANTSGYPGPLVVKNYMVVDGNVLAQSTNRNVPLFYGNAAV